MEQTDPVGLVNLRARTYNPRLGTFTSVDPVLGVGGSTGWNGYLYANANPRTSLIPVGGAAFANDVRGQVSFPMGEGIMKG